MVSMVVYREVIFYLYIGSRGGSVWGWVGKEWGGEYGEGEGSGNRL